MELIEWNLAIFRKPDGSRVFIACEPVYGSGAWRITVTATGGAVLDDRTLTDTVSAMGWIDTVSWALLGAGCKRELITDLSA